MEKKNFNIRKYSKVCSLHFTPTRFINEFRKTSRKEHPNKCHRRLKPDAIPSVYNHLPSYFTTPEPKNRNTKTTCSGRLELENAMEQFEIEDTVSCLENLVDNLNGSFQKDHLSFSCQKSSLCFVFYCFKCDVMPLEVQCCVKVERNLDFTAYCGSSILQKKELKSVMKNNEKITKISDFMNLLSYVKNKVIHKTPGDSINEAIQILKHASSQSLDINKNIHFIIDQLKLLQSSWNCQRYSAFLMTK